MPSPQAIPLFDLQEVDRNSSFNPLPMQYLGSKSRISNWLLSEIESYFSNIDTFVDLFAGTGSVSIAAKKFGYQLFLNDIQPYAYIVLSSLFKEPREGLIQLAREVRKLASDDDLLANGRHNAEGLLREERAQFNKSRNFAWQWEEYKGFCESTEMVCGDDAEVEKLRQENGWNLFFNYYPNTYFGVEQCLQLDTLREYAERLPAESARMHVIAATVTAMTYAVSSTTHLAQYLKPSSGDRSLKLIRRRSKNIIGEVANRLDNLTHSPLPSRPAQIFQADFRLSLENMSLDERAVVYVDPPYFKEHYSRYYHVLDTFCMYDYPRLTYNDRLGATTVGRYREDRTVSDFGLKGSVQNAFSELFDKIKCSGSKLALSYADTSLVSKEELLALAGAAGLHGVVKEIQLMHSGQGQPRNKNVIEYLFLLKP